MASLDIVTVLARLGEDRISLGIRRLLEDITEQTDIGYRVLMYQEENEGSLAVHHHDALIGILNLRASANQACLYQKRMTMTPTVDQVDTLIDIIVRSGLYVPPGEHKPFVITFAESVAPSALARDQHARLLRAIIRAGESRDAESYANRFRESFDGDLHDLVINLFDADTYYGPACAARYVANRTLTQVQHARLISTIIKSVQKRYVVQYLRGFLTNVRGLSPHLVPLILRGMMENGASADDFRFVAKCGTTLNPSEEEYVEWASATHDGTLRALELVVPPFDADEIIV